MEPQPGLTVRAGEDEPQYKVRSDRSGRDGVHKPGALKKKQGAL